MMGRVSAILGLLVLAACLATKPCPVFSQTTQTVQQLYDDGNLSEVITQGKRLLQNTPDDPTLNLLVGRALVDTEAYAPALPYLEYTTGSNEAAAWMKAWAFSYLGKAYFALERYEHARTALTEAISLDATPNATRSAQGWLLTFGFDAVYDAWQTRESSHFIFRFSPLLHRHDLARYVDEHEQAYSTIAAFFGARMPKKIDFFVWDSNQEAGRAGMPPLGFARPEVSLLHARYDQTIGHEMTHVISHHGVRPRAKTPFINEGTAVCFDQSGRDRMATARAVLAQYGRPGASVLDLWEDWEAYPAEVSYPLAGAFVEYLIREGGKRKFIELLKDQTLEHAWDVYGEGLITVVAEFEVSLAQDVPAY